MNPLSAKLSYFEIQNQKTRQSLPSQYDWCNRWKPFIFSNAKQIMVSLDSGEKTCVDGFGDPGRDTEMRQ